MDVLLPVFIGSCVVLFAAGASVGYIAGLSRGGRIAVAAIKSASDSIRGAADRG